MNNIKILLKRVNLHFGARYEHQGGIKTDHLPALEKLIEIIKKPSHSITEATFSEKNTDFLLSHIDKKQTIEDE